MMTFLRLSVCLATLVAGVWSAPTLAADWAVIFMYHRFGESEHPTSNIRLDQFEAHLQELKSGGYSVRPLPEIVKSLRDGTPLPDKTVAITIDEAFASAYREAWPRLKQAGFPFALFLSTDSVDSGSKTYMNWDQVRELRDAGVYIGSQTASHDHLPDLDDETMRLELDRSNARLVAELGEQPTMMAYPFGEYGSEIQRLISRRGYTTAFGQQSGVAHSGSDRLGYPRFVMNEAYGGIDRFRLVAKALPLPVSDRVPEDLVLVENPPAFGFTIPPSLGDPTKLDCYASGQGKTKTQVLGHRIEVRLVEPFPPGRSRVNCTMAGPDNRWRWFGVQFYIPR